MTANKLVICSIGLASLSLSVGLFGSQERPLSGRTGQQLVYAAAPGAGSNYQRTGILIFDVANDWKFVKRVPTWDYPPGQRAESITGIAAHAETHRLYLATGYSGRPVKGRLAAFDLLSEKMVWEQTFDGQCCDRMALSPDGAVMYVPALTGSFWYVVDAKTGTLIKKVDTPQSLGAHNTLYSLDGSHVFMAGVYKPFISVADTKTHTVVKTVGPFGNFSPTAPAPAQPRADMLDLTIRPFTVNGEGTLLFVNLNGLIGFEVADVTTGKVLHRVEAAGYMWTPERLKGHGTPSHGVALSPDEKEVWVADSANDYLHVFDATVMPPKQKTSLKTRPGPHWITFGLDGKYVYPSTGEVFDAATKTVVGVLRDETGEIVQSEKLLEMFFMNGKPVRTVDQFGVGLVRGTSDNSAR